MKSVKTYWSEILMAGNLAVAEQVCRKYCQKGLCISIRSQNYIYTDGEEVGFVIGLMNYPRFPQEPRDIFNDSIRLAIEVATACCQRSFTIMDQYRTRWYSKSENEWDIAKDTHEE